mmetsp:Transcript_13522/g.16107  ORF Transcript_13522/g.16107 Transcript_13522/m.16107 type:complete len:140 (-) Transcript_13522:1562-1981(-)
MGYFTAIPMIVIVTGKWTRVCSMCVEIGMHMNDEDTAKECLGDRREVVSSLPPRPFGYIISFFIEYGGAGQHAHTATFMLSVFGSLLDECGRNRGNPRQLLIATTCSQVQSFVVGGLNQETVAIDLRFQYSLRRQAVQL